MLYSYNRRGRIQQLAAIAMQPKDTSNEKIAYDLMQHIASQENLSIVPEKTKKPRKYYLELYSQCLRIVSGEDYDDVADDLD